MKCNCEATDVNECICGAWTSENNRYRAALAWIATQNPSERCIENKMIARAKQALKGDDNDV